MNKNMIFKTQLLYVCALFCAAMIAGCGSSEQTVLLTTHQLLSDSLNGEINQLNSHNSALQNQVVALEKEKTLQSDRIADLETMVTSLKEELATLSPLPTKSNNLSGRETYLRALRLFNERNYSEAAALFQMLLEKGAPPSLDDNCHYWLGECAYGSKNYNDAVGYFQKVFVFEISEKKDESQIMIARSYVAMGNKAQAKEEYQKLIDTYPASPYLQRAKEQMGRY